MRDTGGLVMPPHESTFNVPRRAGAVGGGGVLIDGGCGSGVIGISQAADYDLVIAVDIEPAAVRYTCMNSVINDQPPRVVEGNLLGAEMVALGGGDHLIFNAPASIGEWRTDFAEAGRRLLHELCSALPRLVRSGGIAHVNLLIEVPGSLGSPAVVVEQGLRSLRARRREVFEFRDSGFHVSPESIERGLTPPGWLLVREPRDRTRIIDLCRTRGIREIVPAVVMVQL